MGEGKPTWAVHRARGYAVRRQGGSPCELFLLLCAMRSIESRGRIDAVRGKVRGIGRVGDLRGMAGTLNGGAVRVPGWAVLCVACPCETGGVPTHRPRCPPSLSSGLACSGPADAVQGGRNARERSRALQRVRGAVSRHEGGALAGWGDPFGGAGIGSMAGGGGCAAAWPGRGTVAVSGGGAVPGCAFGRGPYNVSLASCRSASSIASRLAPKFRNASRRLLRSVCINAANAVLQAMLDAGQCDAVQRWRGHKLKLELHTHTEAVQGNATDNAQKGEGSAVHGKSPCDELDEHVVDLSMQGGELGQEAQAAKSPRPARLQVGSPALRCSLST